MSYRPKRPNDDSLYAFFSDMACFHNILPNLLNAEKEREFSLWLDKMYEINKRSLYLYITNNPEKFKPEFHKIINIKFQKHIIG